MTERTRDLNKPTRMDRALGLFLGAVGLSAAVVFLAPHGQGSDVSSWEKVPVVAGPGSTIEGMVTKEDGNMPPEEFQDVVGDVIRQNGNTSNIQPGQQLQIPVPPSSKK